MYLRFKNAFNRLKMSELQITYEKKFVTLQIRIHLGES